MTSAIAAGVEFFQYRNKRGNRRLIYDVSVRLALVARESGVLFIVNDHPDIALAAGADGVHLGQDDLPIDMARRVVGREKIIGISTHSREQACEAQSRRADYIGFGPVFPTSTKDAGELQGLENIRLIRQCVSLPVIAIGGISLANVKDVMETGADGAAVISAILSAPDLKEASAEFVKRAHRKQGGA